MLCNRKIAFTSRYSLILQTSDVKPMQFMDLWPVVLFVERNQWSKHYVELGIYVYIFLSTIHFLSFFSRYPNRPNYLTMLILFFFFLSLPCSFTSLFLVYRCFSSIVESRPLFILFYKGLWQNSILELSLTNIVQSFFCTRVKL